MDPLTLVNRARALAAFRQVLALTLADGDCCHDCVYGSTYRDLWHTVETYERATGDRLSLEQANH